MLLELCWYLPGTFVEPLWNILEPVWNLAGTVLELCWNFAGTFLEPCWICAVVVILSPKANFSVLFVLLFCRLLRFNVSSFA